MNPPQAGLTGTHVAYQSCRWYDTYPRLSFALQMLYLAPQTLRLQLVLELQAFLGVTFFGEPSGNASSNHQKSRWYDDCDETSRTVAFLQNSPDPVKHLSANKLLEMMEALDIQEDFEAEVSSPKQEAA